MLTLKQALTFGGLKDAFVIAGEDHLDRVIKSVSILEIAEPMVSQWASSDELYISSLYSIPDNLSAQKKVIRALNNCGCTGLVIGHLGLWFEKIPPEIIELCNTLGFPLVIANPKICYQDIINPIYNYLMDIRSDNEYANLYTETLHILTYEKNIYEALKKIAVISNTPVSFFDFNNNCIYSNKDEPEKLRDSVLVNEDQRDFSIIIGDKTILPIVNNSKYHGCIVLDGNYDINKLPTHIHNLVMAYTFLLANRRRTPLMRSEFTIDYLMRLVNYDFQSEQSAIEALKTVGINAQEYKYIIAIVHDLSKENLSDQQLNETIFFWLQEKTKKIIRNYSDNNSVLIIENTLLLLVNDFSSPLELEKLQNELLSLFSEQKGFPFSIGLSDPIERVSRIKQAKEEAVSAAKIGQAFLQKKYCRYKDIWVLHHFYEMQDTKNSQLARETLLPLLESDLKNGTSLVETFRVLLESNNDINLAAEKLFVHRNTVRYRRDKILELLGESPFVFPQSLIYYVSILLIKEMK